MTQTPPIRLRDRRRDLTCIALGAATCLIAGLVFAATRAEAVEGDGGESMYVPMTPCRLFDTRPNAEFNIGPRATPLGPTETYTQQVTGTNGECVVPESATGVSLNVTVVGPTEPSWLVLWPAGEDRPLAANLNYVPGTAPTPNKVDVALSEDGRLSLLNRFGTAHVVADVGGFYTGTWPGNVNEAIAALQDQVGDDDLSAQVEANTAAIAALESRLDSLEGSVTTVESDVTTIESDLLSVSTDLGVAETAITALDDALPFVVSAVDASEAVTSSAVEAVTVEVTAPVDGHVTVIGSTTTATLLGELTRCSISDDDGLDLDYLLQRAGIGLLSGADQIAGSRTFAIAEGATVQYDLVCDHSGLVGSTVTDSVLTAIFTPAP